MYRQEKPKPHQRPEPRFVEVARWSALWMGLAGILGGSAFGCQVIAGLEELKLAAGTADGGIGGGSAGATSGASSSSSSSSSGEPIMGDVLCGAGTCPIGPESACCSDHYQLSADPFVECVKGLASNDGCNTAGGANGYETRIECQLPAHCPKGTVCCGNIETISIMDWYPSLSCQAACNWPDTVVCDPMNPMNDCPIVNDQGTMVQTTCLGSDLLPAGYSVCRIGP